MPRVFNRIRKQLAIDNKFFQYSRYSIGEILLVVIGILIALQIYNWNEDRKKKRLEKELLNELAASLKPDLREVEINPDHHKEVMNSQNTVWNWIGSKEEITDYNSLRRVLLLFFTACGQLLFLCLSHGIDFF